MTDKEKEKLNNTINELCEVLGFTTPLNIMKVAAVTTDLFYDLQNVNEELEKENAELKSQIENMQIKEYSNLCEQRKIIHRNLIEAFSEQLGILDKEEDELFSLKAIKAVISNVLELAE